MVPYMELEGVYSIVQAPRVAKMRRPLAVQNVS
jgi:hypothetical protein